MAITVEAIYENGMLKLEKPLPLQEHEKVNVTVEQARPPIWERIAALTADATEEELAKLPTNGAADIDNHLYGTPKGPENVTVEKSSPTLAERIAARAGALPPETLDRLPVDGASQHDHYIYGTPKRSE